MRLACPGECSREYLRRLYLENELIHGHFEVEGAPINTGSIQIPVFNVGTETDHVAPWRAVYKTRAYTRSPDFTFLLTSGGHNARHREWTAKREASISNVDMARRRHCAQSR